MKHPFRKQWFAGLTATLLMSLSLTVSADSSRAFIPMGNADSVGVMNLENHRLTSTISGTVNTHGSALTPDGRFLIVGSLTAHDGQKTPDRPAGVSEDEHAAHHGGGNTTAPEASGTGRIYVVDNDTTSGEAVALKVSEGAVTTRYEIGGSPHGLDLSAGHQISIGSQ